VPRTNDARLPKFIRQFFEGCVLHLQIFVRYYKLLSFRLSSVNSRLRVAVQHEPSCDKLTSKEFHTLAINRRIADLYVYSVLDEHVLQQLSSSEHSLYTPSASSRVQEWRIRILLISLRSSIAVHIKSVLHLDQNTTVVSGYILSEKSLRCTRLSYSSIYSHVAASHIQTSTNVLWIRNCKQKC